MSNSELDFYNLIFQKSCTDQQGVWLLHKWFPPIVQVRGESHHLRIGSNWKKRRSRCPKGVVEMHNVLIFFWRRIVFLIFILHMYIHLLDLYSNCGNHGSYINGDIYWYNTLNYQMSEWFLVDCSLKDSFVKILKRLKDRFCI